MYPTGAYDNYKYIYLQQRSSKIHKPTLNQNKETYRLKYINSRGPQHPNIRSRQNTLRKTKQRIKGFECHTRRVGPHRYIQNTTPQNQEYSFYSNAHGTFSRIDHVLGHKTGLNRYQKTEIIPCIFSDNNTLKLELNHNEKFGRNSNTWRLRTILLRNYSITRK